MLQIIAFTAPLAAIAAAEGSAYAQVPTLQLPPDASTLLGELLLATVAPVPATGSPGSGLYPLLDSSGNIVTLYNSDGAYAAVYTDADGNTIVNYQLSVRSSQYNTATATLDGTPPSQLPAYADAVTFLTQVARITQAQGRSLNQIYVTGFSEGGELASYVGWQTGVSGVSFGSSGLPGYTANGHPAGNFINFVEAGDPIGQYGSDTIERGSAITENANFEHYGTLVQLEMPPAGMDFIASGINGHTLTAVYGGTSGIPDDELQQGMATESNLQTQYHNMTTYTSDTNAFAQQYGY